MSQIKKNDQGTLKIILETITSSKTIVDLFKIHPKFIILAFEGKWPEEIHEYHQILHAFCSKASDLMTLMKSFDERWSVWKVCFNGNRTSDLINKQEELPTPAFAKERIARCAMELALQVSTFDQAREVWSRARSTPIGIKALERMAYLANTVEDHWQVALLAKDRLPEVCKKSIKFLAEKL